MNDVEITEEWLFERLRIREERKFHDPEDAYLEVRRQKLSALRRAYRRESSS
jgi:hypothetical protein